MSTASLITLAEGSTNGVPGSGKVNIELLTGGVLQATFANGMIYTLAPGGPFVPGGRLCLTSGQPVPTADVTGAGTIYYTNHHHNGIRLYTGSEWRGFNIPEIAMPLTLTSGKNYDKFIFFSSLTPSSTNTSTDIITFSNAHSWNTGAVAWVSTTGGGLTPGVSYFVNAASSTTISLHTTLANALAGTSKVDLTASITATITAVSLKSSTAWTTDTARADALTTQNGVYVKSGATTRLWVGTIRASSSNSTSLSFAPAAGSATAKLFVWNAYNQIPRRAVVNESANTWTYTTATWRSMNNNALNRIEYVAGMAGLGLSATAVAFASNTDALSVSNGVGVNSTTVNSAQFIGLNIAANAWSKLFAQYGTYTALGYHYLQALEYSQATGTTTWGGDVGDATLFGNGIFADVLI